MSSRPRIRVCAFITRDERVLLVRQRRGASTYWLLPGGGVERGESLADALAREVEEECGLTVEISGPPLAVVQTISPDGGLSRHLIQLVFPARIAPRRPDGPLGFSPPPGRDPAIQEVEWFGVGALPGLTLHPPINGLLSSWLAAGGPTSIGAAGPCLVTEPLWAPD